MLFAYQVYCIALNVLQNTFTMKSNNMNLIRLLLREESDLSPCYLQYRYKLHKQMREQTKIVVNGKLE